MFGNVTRSRPYSPPKPTGGVLGPAPDTSMDRKARTNSGLDSLTKYLPTIGKNGRNLQGLFPKRRP